MERPTDGPGPELEPVFRIILHVSPTIDADVTHWTEAPECPAANEDGQSPDEAVERTKAIICTWWRRAVGQSDEGLKFVVIQGN